MIVPQVDHIDAVREIEAIAAVSGFNALFIEPQGIAASLGYPGQISHSEVSAAISRVQHICDDAERRTGICVQDLNGAARWMGENLTLLAVSSDAMMMSQRARDVLQVLR